MKVSPFVVLAAEFTRQVARTRCDFPLSRGRAFHYEVFGIQNGLVFQMYKGDILPADAHQRLAKNPQAVLIDVRTEPEWAFVGVPAVDRLIRLSWQAYPQMQLNADFVKQVEDSGLAKDTEILCICRSGARSANAAAALTKAGFTNCWNVAQGFEGDRDRQGHRGTVGGWKAAGLPWIQS